MSAYIAPFAASLVDIFASMFQCALTPAKSSHTDKMHTTRDVTAIVGLAGKAEGNIVISLDSQVALSLTESMLGQRPATLDENVIDAVGETLNIIAGQAKAQLGQLALNLGIPTVVTGSGQAIRFTGQPDPTWYVFDSQWGSVELCVGLMLSQGCHEPVVLCGAHN
ncbi:MAG: chemotaxis protein CheX [Pirellulaceae bacterium]